MNLEHDRCCNNGVSSSIVVLDRRDLSGRVEPLSSRAAVDRAPANVLRQLLR